MKMKTKKEVEEFTDRVKEWWESLPYIKKHNIVDYKRTDYTWDDLNEIDKQLIEIHMQNSEGTQQ